MALKVVFSARANRDLEQVVLHLAQKSPRAAERLGSSVIDHALSLGELPFLGIAVRERPGVRRLVHPPWLLIYYRVDEPRAVVEIVRVWDGRQDPATFRLT